jgi:hypothetical protein
MKLKWKVNDITGEKELERINHIILDINEILSLQELLKTNQRELLIDFMR